MKIVFISLSDASDVRSWSGLTYHISKALASQPGVQVIYLDKLAEKSKGIPYLVQGVKKVLYGKLGKHIDIKLSPWRLKKIGKILLKLLPQDADIIFADSSLPLAYLKTDIPKVFYTDATFASILGFYRPISSYAKETIRNGNKIDRLAIQASKIAIYSSDWAAASAIKDYECSSDKIKVVPFGANIECDRTSNDIDALARNRTDMPVCNFLFLGVDWARKGGDFAVEVVKKMNSLGVPSVLHIAGIPNLSDYGEFVVNHGFISKREEAGRNRLSELMSNSHFLLLPTRADCTPVAYSEANSFGLPVLTTDVGGIRTIVRDGVNGWAFPLSASAQEYADFAISVFQDKDRYRKMCLSSFDEFEKNLNWHISGKRIIELLKNIK
ncbi:glycosyltransferase family 4 protein [Terrimonas sp. NA20]|uniref:Glycosyltransferase family 4 protein n=1 Tax=Terrimonas ginsenosidimutans TaxID=2908004 RepID=A0ABS9L0T6_9BACT|nr:glycosyltransferase family 4 protein [Terrimonas ginsenosidimutans]MCG2618077.1 glycosyltransferase family 4 protein [Terrimonas ginsenosidimutans]